MSIPLEEMSLRWKRVQEAMGKGNLGGLLVFANQLKTVSIHYVSGYTLLTCPTAGKTRSAGFDC